ARGERGSQDTATASPGRPWRAAGGAAQRTRPGLHARPQPARDCRPAGPAPGHGQDAHPPGYGKAALLAARGSVVKRDPAACVVRNVTVRGLVLERSWDARGTA